MLFVVRSIRVHNTSSILCGQILNFWCLKQAVRSATAPPSAVQTITIRSTLTHCNTCNSYILTLGMRNLARREYIFGKRWQQQLCLFSDAVSSQTTQRRWQINKYESLATSQLTWELVLSYNTHLATPAHYPVNHLYISVHQTFATVSPATTVCQQLMFCASSTVTTKCRTALVRPEGQVRAQWRTF